MYCSHCGTHNDRVEVCGTCGTTTGWPYEVDVSTGGPPSSVPGGQRPRTRLVVGLVAAVAVALVVGGIVGWQQWGDSSPVAGGTSSTERTSSGDRDGSGDDAVDYGDDAGLDELWDDCDGGDDDACEELYLSTPVDSEYERFGATCGDRDPDGASCGSGIDDWSDEDGVRAGGYGDDPELDGLWDDCAAGDDEACSELYWSTAYDSEYERFALTCGDRDESGAVCGLDEEGRYGDGWEGATDYGDDPELDALYDDCADGDDDACEDLYWEVPVDSEYEAFAESCGGRDPSGRECGLGTGFWDIVLG